MPGMSGILDKSTVEALYQAIRLVRPIHLNVARTVERQLDGTGMTVSMRAILELLIEEGTLSGPQITARLAFKRQFVHRTLTAMHSAGLVETRANARHKRSVLYAASASGRAAFKRVHDNELRILGEYMGDISQTDIHSALKVMRHADAIFSAIAAQDS